MPCPLPAAAPDPPPIADHTQPVTVTLRPLDRPAAVEPMWRDLEERADGSFFLSWLWVGTWLHHRPPGSAPHLLVARRGEQVVGLAVLCRRTLWRFALLRTRCWLLHESGDPVFDRLFVEYNGILADRRCADAVLAASFGWLSRHLPGFDDMLLAGLDAAAEAAARRAAGDAGLAVRLHHADAAQWVDLAGLRGSEDYRATLGKNTRAALKRALRLYGERGPVTFRTAATAAEALADFAALEPLHQASWVARGQAGAFANPAFRPFHRDLIAAGVPTGLVRLCRVDAGDRAIGFLYNFVWRGRVMNYQGGFAYEADNRLKPGLVSHVLAIEDTLARGEGVYDFMSTPAGHKPLLSNGGQPMNWLAAGPDRLGRRVEERLCHLRARLKALLRRPPRPRLVLSGDAS